MYLALVDLTSAFNCVDHEILFQLLDESDVSTKFLSYIMALYGKGNARNRGVWRSLTSEAYSLERGVRQGKPLSGDLFNLYVDDLTEAFSENRMITLKLKT